MNKTTLNSQKEKHSTLSLRRATVRWKGNRTNPLFLSTLSLRRATSLAYNQLHYSKYFYPRSPCGERRQPAPRTPSTTLFLSTLSLRRATQDRGAYFIERLFLSTLSLRRATNLCISIIQLIQHFYPRSPCGERLVPVHIGQQCVEISIHALLAESDQSRRACTAYAHVFLSTLSLRRATLPQPPQRPTRPFLSTLSLRRATLAVLCYTGSLYVFLSTLSLRRATVLCNRRK